MNRFFCGMDMDLPKTRHILLCLRYGIGDLIMELPVIESLRRRLPQARITAVGARPATEILEESPFVDEVFCIQDWGLIHWGDRGNPQIRADICSWLKKEQPDLILDPSHAVAALKEVIREQPLPVRDSRREAAELALQNGSSGLQAINASVRHGWGLAVPEDPPRVFLTEKNLRFAEKFWTRHLGTAAAIALSPVASSPLKLWPLERFTAIADWAIENYHSPVLIFGGPRSDAVEAIKKGMKFPRKAITVGKLPLGRIAALLSRCALLICPDTGLMHLAAAVGTPVIALFGPTAPRIYLPPGPAALAVSGSGADCPFQKRTSFGHPDCVVAGHCLRGRTRCIADVAVPEVLLHLQSLFSRKPEDARSVAS